MNAFESMTQVDQEGRWIARSQARPSIGTPHPGTTQGLRERLEVPRVYRHVEISVITGLRTEQGVDTPPTAIHRGHPCLVGQIQDGQHPTEGGPDVVRSAGTHGHSVRTGSRDSRATRPTRPPSGQRRPRGTSSSTPCVTSSSSTTDTGRVRPSRTFDPRAQRGRAHDLHSSRSSSLKLPAATQGRSSCSALSIHSLAGGTLASDSKRRCIRARLHKWVELAAVVNRISRSPSELARGRFRSRPSASRCRTRRSAAYR